MTGQPLALGKTWGLILWKLRSTHMESEVKGPKYIITSFTSVHIQYTHTLQWLFPIVPRTLHLLVYVNAMLCTTPSTIPHTHSVVENNWQRHNIPMKQLCDNTSSLPGTPLNGQHQYWQWMIEPWNGITTSVLLEDAKTTFYLITVDLIYWLKGSLGICDRMHAWFNSSWCRPGHPVLGYCPPSLTLTWTRIRRLLLLSCCSAQCMPLDCK